MTGTKVAKRSLRNEPNSTPHRELLRLFANLFKSSFQLVPNLPHFIPSSYLCKWKKYEMRGRNGTDSNEVHIDCVSKNWCWYYFELFLNSKPWMYPKPKERTKTMKSVQFKRWLESRCIYKVVFKIYERSFFLSISFSFNLSLSLFFGCRFW